MSELVVQTVQDLRAGRTSWRVIAMLTLPAFVVGIATGLAQVQ